MYRRAVVLAVVSSVLLASCAIDKMKTRETILDDTLKMYSATIRWGDMTQALAFVDPKVREAHPLSELDLARYQQVRVTAYNDQPAAPISENEVQQVVEIGIVNVNTQGARSLIDRQVWRYDEKEKHWWLMTGLPDITRHD
jgi:hypothetical protein